MSGKIPIYQVVKESLREKIDTGILTTGERISSEEELASEFGCSRLTVHRALRELADEGLVVRRRRAGTLVAPRDSGEVMFRVPRIREEIEALGLSYRYEFLDRRHGVPRAAVLKLLRVEGRRKMLRIVARHWAGDRVFQHEDRWLNLDIVPDAVDVDFSAASAYDWLYEHAPYSCIDHEISAITADAPTAFALDVDEGAALLRIRRLTHLTVRRVSYAVLLHPGDLFTVRSETRGYSLNSS